MLDKHGLQMYNYGVTKYCQKVHLLTMYVLTSTECDTELSADGYLFLIDLADREYYLPTCEEVFDVLSNTVMDELFNEFQQFRVDGNYESAFSKIIR